MKKYKSLRYTMDADTAERLRVFALNNFTSQSRVLRWLINNILDGKYGWQVLDDLKVECIMKMYK